MATGEQEYDLIIVGGGPGGYTAAIRAAQLGMKTACVEKERTLGGVCLNIGCIPSKALLDSTELLLRIQTSAEKLGVNVSGAEGDLPTILRRKERIVTTLTKGIEYLFRKNGVEWLRGSGRLLDPNRIEVQDGDGNARRITAKNVLLATGSVPIPFPGVPFDEQRVLSSTGALSLSAVPNHLMIIGAGPIGLELGSVWLRLGAKVTVLELMPAILPGLDEEVVKTADRILRKQGFDFRTGVRVEGIEKQDNGVVVKVEGSEPLSGDHVLVAIGRRPYTEGLGAAEVGVQFGPKGTIIVDERYYTGVGGVYAIGDAIGGMMLAHKAEEEGVAAVENIAGKVGHVNYNALPGVVYTSPEIASVGKTEGQLRSEGREIRVGRFPFSANSRARTLDETDGFVKVIADAQTDRLLGLHIIGPHASDLIAEAALAMEFEASAEDIGVSVHAHPTLPEVVKEAALNVLGRSINI